MANPVPVTYNAGVGEKIAGGRHSQDLTLTTYIDAGSMIQSTFQMDALRSVRATVAGSARNGTRHWIFRVEKARGRRPVFEIDISNMAGTFGAEWRPTYSYDGVTWTAASSVERLASPARARWQFDEAFTQQDVLVGNTPVYQYARSVALAARLAADSSGRVSPSASANSSGVIFVGRTGTDTLGRQQGGKFVHGFVLTDPTLTPAIGARKRVLVLTCGIHAGEPEDGWSNEGVIDYWLSGVGTDADQFRREWTICAYFLLNANGRAAGYTRTNIYGEDPNRDWGDWLIDENVAVRDAMIADAAFHDAHIDFHSQGGESNHYGYQKAALSASMYTAWQQRFNALNPFPISMGSTSATGTLTEWVRLNRSPTFVLTSEATQVIQRPTGAMRAVGENYARALMEIQRLGHLG